MGIDRHIVSVVVPTVGRDTLTTCRDALGVQTRPPDEILFITDSDRRGPAWARNEGIRRSLGDLIAFTDDDCAPPRDWLERLIRAIDRYDAAGAGGTFRETDELLHRKRLRRGFPGIEQVDTVGWVANSGNVMYRRAWLDACRTRDGFVFDESFHTCGGEDVELAWRLRRRGAKLIFVPTPVIHLRRVTPREYFVHQYRRGKGIGMLFLAHRSVDTDVSAQGSLLRTKADSGKGRAGLAVFWRKVIGPFDMRSFPTAKGFAVFWVGEKCEGAGFVQYLAKRWWTERRSTGRRGAA